MDVLRVHLRGWTASFRYPGFAVAVHPSLPMPPLSTLYGLLSAARGQAVTPADTQVGFVFSSSGEAHDLETTYELTGVLEAKTNVVRRHILFEPDLWLYLSNLDFEPFFRRPHYSLLLGRSTELVQVASVERVRLEPEPNKRLGKTMVPFPQPGLYGALQSLPTHFSDEMPRRALGTRPFMLLEAWQPHAEPLPFDVQNNWAVWMHS
jgi:CRISPR-associated protein Cas5t